MVSTFDRIVIAVPDLQAASEEYRCLLGKQAFHPDDGKGQAVWFGLANTVIELVPSAAGPAFIRGLVFAGPGAGPVARPVANARGLDISLCDGLRTAALRERHAMAAEGDPRVDHLVLHTADAAGCVDLFARELGIRLALDRDAPEWGGRMLFFRAGKLTLEVIEPSRDKVAQDFFWGIAYQCADIAQAVLQLAGRGVALSAVRPGRKPGTRVATVRSHCLGIPTLLLQPAT